MGVRGLTSYIYDNADRFLEHFNLCDSYLVIDGNCLASIIFQQSISHTSCFGGDYDRYAKAVEYFFNDLLKCSIRPLVIFDGGYERKKLKTVRFRNSNKVCSLESVSPSNYSSQSFPLMMRQVFRDVLNEMLIPHAQSDFEADGEIAAIARKLNCPVLSNDSDFFIFDVLYIPLQAFPSTASKNLDGSGYYFPCKIYKVDNFLQRQGGLSKTMLPLLAVLLGNDYISRNNFNNFYSQKFNNCKIKNIVSRVRSIINWLKTETFESALRKILNHLKKHRKKMIAHKVAKIVEGYTKMSSPLNEYILQDYDIQLEEMEILSITNICQQYEEALSGGEEDESIVKGDDELESECSEGQESSRNSSGEDVELAPDTLTNISGGYLHFPKWFLDCSRRGLIPNSLLTLVSLNTYFCVPQVEEYEFQQAGSIGVPILCNIAGLALGPTKFSYYSRSNTRYASVKLTAITTSPNFSIFPLLNDINSLRKRDRKIIFTDIFGGSYNQVLEQFPKDWHIFLSALMFWSNNMKEPLFQIYHLHSIILMFIGLQIVGSKIGYYRNKRPFMQRYASKIKSLSNYSSHLNLTEVGTVKQILEVVPLEECLIAFDSMLPYFHMDERHRTNPKLFSRSTVHAYAQFQVCVDLANCLNSLLLSPYRHCYVHKFYNSSFLYNVSINLKKRCNILAYMETFFVRCPTLFSLYKMMFRLLENSITLNKPVYETKRRRKKKCHKQVIALSSKPSGKTIEETSEFTDEDNKYSLLANLM